MEPQIDEQFCINHPSTPTNLRCSKCERPICQKCAVRTQVGLRCATCAGVRQTRDGMFYVPTVLTQVSGKQYAFATLAALAVAVVGGIGWGQWSQSDGFSWGFWWVLGITLVVGEVIGRVTNERRSTGLQILAAGSVFMAAVVAIAWQYFFIHDLALGNITSVFTNQLWLYQLDLSLSNAFFVSLGMFVATRRLEV